MSSNKQKIIEKFIELAGKEGVSEEVLCKASEEVTAERRGYIRYFYDGLEEVIIAIEDMFDGALDVNEDIQNTKSITEKVRIALKERVIGESVHYEFRNKLNNYYKSFSGANLFLKNSWKTCDHIWRLAGDKSLDFNYYSKRILLYTIYTKAYKAYFCGNNQDKVQKTLASIDKGLDRVKNINQLKLNLSLDNIPFLRMFVK